MFCRAFGFISRTVASISRSSLFNEQNLFFVFFLHFAGISNRTWSLVYSWTSVSMIVLPFSAFTVETLFWSERFAEAFASRPSSLLKEFCLQSEYIFLQLTFVVWTIVHSFSFLASPIFIFERQLFLIRSVPISLRRWSSLHVFFAKDQLLLLCRNFSASPCDFECCRLSRKNDILSNFGRQIGSCILTSCFGIVCKKLKFQKCLPFKFIMIFEIYLYNK